MLPSCPTLCKPCVALWNYALSLKVDKETLLSCDTSFTARAVVQLYVNVLARDGFADSTEEESESATVDFSEVPSMLNVRTSSRECPRALKVVNTAGPLNWVLGSILSGPELLFSDSGALERCSFNPMRRDA